MGDLLYVHSLADMFKLFINVVHTADKAVTEDSSLTGNTGSVSANYGDGKAKGDEAPRNVQGSKIYSLVYFIQRTVSNFILFFSSSVWIYGLLCLKFKIKDTILSVG